MRYGLAILLILFAALALAGCGSGVTGNPNEGVAPADPPTPTETPAATATPQPPQIDTPVSQPTATLQPTSTIAPSLGAITFAPDITADYEPVAPGLIFTSGITQVHAIFEYQGMATGQTWERVWYYNDQELARSGGPWTDTGSGLFTYTIDNGGAPLPSGDYLLEIFVDGELQTLGMFVIDEEEE